MGETAMSNYLLLLLCLLSGCAVGNAPVTDRTVLILGASVSSEFNGNASPGRMMAERRGQPWKMSAIAGSLLEDVLRESEVSSAAVVVSVDGFYWYKDMLDCGRALAAMDRLFAVRGGKPMVLGTIPYDGPWCGRTINAELEKRCIGSCSLIDFRGDLRPKELHPGAQWTKLVADRMEKLWPSPIR